MTWRLLAVLAVALAAAACQDPEGARSTDSYAARTTDQEVGMPMRRAVLDFVLQPEAGRLDLDDRRQFHVVDAEPTHDDLGHPAVSFRIDPDEEEELRQWTGAHVGRQMIISFEGQRLISVVIASPLSGNGMISFGPYHATDAEARALADRLLPRR